MNIQGSTDAVETGIRQGESLGPTLFNLIVDKVIYSVKKVNAGYKMGDQRIQILWYADDILLPAESEDGCFKRANQMQICCQ